MSFLRIFPGILGVIFNYGCILSHGLPGNQWLPEAVEATLEGFRWPCSLSLSVDIGILMWAIGR